MSNQPKFHAQLRGRAVVLGAIAAGAFAGSALLESEALADHPAGSGGKFTVHVNRPFRGFDPIKVPQNDMGRIQVQFAVHDLLFYQDRKNGKLIPRLGLAATHSPDFKKWQVTLRRGVKYSNGEELTAEAYVHHFDRLLGSRLAPRYRAALGSPLAKVVALGKYKIEFQFNAPAIGFDAILSEPAFIWYVNAPGFAKTNENSPDYPRKLVGAGPYKLKEWVHGKGITLVRNPLYWNKKEQHADEIFYRVTTGPEAVGNWNAIQAGDLDASWTFGDLIARGRKQTAMEFTSGYRAYSGLVVNFNASIEPFNDTRVRRALAHALDRKQIVDIATKGSAIVADQGFDPNRKWHCANINYPEYNPEKAKALLKEYGKPLPSVEIWNHGGFFTKTAEVVQAMWKKVGFDVKLKKVGPGPVAIFKNVARGKVPTWVFLGGQAAHPAVFNANLHSQHKGNIWKIKSPKLDAAIAKVKAARGDAEIKAAHCAFEQAKADVVPFIYLSYAEAGLFYKKNIGGIEPPTNLIFGYHRIFRKK